MEGESLLEAGASICWIVVTMVPASTWREKKAIALGRKEKTNNSYQETNSAPAAIPPQPLQLFNKKKLVDEKVHACMYTFSSIEVKIKNS